MFKNNKGRKYIMNDCYEINDLIVGNLEWISSKPTLYGPTIETTKQKYIFELADSDDEGKLRYREVFTGLIAGTDVSEYFDVPRVINIKPLKEKLSLVDQRVASKYDLLMILNEINTKKVKVKKKIK